MLCSLLRCRYYSREVPPCLLLVETLGDADLGGIGLERATGQLPVVAIRRDHRLQDFFVALAGLITRQHDPPARSSLGLARLRQRCRGLCGACRGRAQGRQRHLADLGLGSGQVGNRQGHGAVDQHLDEFHRVLHLLGVLDGFRIVDGLLDDGLRQRAAIHAHDAVGAVLVDGTQRLLQVGDRDAALHLRMFLVAESHLFTGGGRVFVGRAAPADHFEFVSSATVAAQRNAHRTPARIMVPAEFRAHEAQDVCVFVRDGVLDHVAQDFRITTHDHVHVELHLVVGDASAAIQLPRSPASSPALVEGNRYTGQVNTVAHLGQFDDLGNLCTDLFDGGHCVLQLFAAMCVLCRNRFLASTSVTQYAG